MADSDLKSAVKEEWDIEVIAKGLDEEPWRFTEPKRIDRMTFIASYNKIEGLARDTVPEEEIEEAEENDSLPELLDDVTREYIDALAEEVGEAMKSHVYGTTEEGDVFVGQYEDGEEDELREEFEVESNEGPEEEEPEAEVEVEEEVED